MDPRVEEILKRPQLVQRSPEWFEARESLITASDAAAALDIKPFESFTKSARAELLRKKVYPEPFSSPAMAHGVKYEGEAREKYEAMSGEEVLEFGLLIHPELTWLGASPDGITKSGKMVEIKCPTGRQIVPGHVPEHYFPQVQVCLEVCNLEEAVFIQYKPEELVWPKEAILDITYVKRDREWFQTNVEKLHSFWKEMMEAKAAKVPRPEPAPKRARGVTKMPTTPCLICDDLYEEICPTNNGDVCEGVPEEGCENEEQPLP